jgi:hypothetical protein
MDWMSNIMLGNNEINKAAHNTLISRGIHKRCILSGMKMQWAAATSISP